MKLAALALALGLLSSCVDAPPDEGTVAQEASPGDCLGNFGVTAPLPAHVPWSGALPGTVSTQEVWVILPRDNQGLSWGLYQVDLVKRRVSKSISFSGQQRTSVYAALGTSVHAAGGVRVPPPVGPGPVGDDWRQANYIVNLGARIYFAPLTAIAATP